MEDNKTWEQQYKNLHIGGVMMAVPYSHILYNCKKGLEKPYPFFTVVFALIMSMAFIVLVTLYQKFQPQIIALNEKLGMQSAQYQ